MCQGMGVKVKMRRKESSGLYHGSCQCNQTCSLFTCRGKGRSQAGHFLRPPALQALHHQTLLLFAHSVPRPVLNRSFLEVNEKKNLWLFFAACSVVVVLFVKLMYSVCLLTASSKTIYLFMVTLRFLPKPFCFCMTNCFFLLVSLFVVLVAFLFLK